MKRLIKKAGYQESSNYTQENEVHWSNIYNNLWGMPTGFKEELQNSLENYSGGADGVENPLSVCNNWLNNPGLKSELDAQQLTTLQNIQPEIDVIF